MVDQDQERNGIPIQWEFGDIRSVYATNLIVQAGEGDMFIAFFEIRPPIVFSEADREGITSVTAQCVARVVISPDRMQGFIDAMQGNLNEYLARVAQKDKNDDDSDDEK